MPFGPYRRRLWLDNPREWQIPRAARRNLVLRGDGPRSAIKKPYAAIQSWHGGGSRATRTLLITTRVPASAPVIALYPPSQLCDITKPSKPISSGNVANQYLVGSVSPSATRSAPTLRRAARSAQYRDAPAAPSAAPSAMTTTPRALAPRDCLPRFCRQAESERLRRDPLMLQVASKQLRGRPIPLPGCAGKGAAPVADAVIVTDPAT